MSTMGLNPDLDLKKSQLKKLDLALEKNNTETSENDVDIETLEKSSGATEKSLKTTTEKLESLKGDKSGIAGEMASLRQSLETETDDEVRKERLLQINDFENELAELEREEQKLKEEEQEHIETQKQQKVKKTKLNQESVKLKEEKVDLDNQKSQTESEISKIKLEYIPEKEEADKKGGNTKTISETESTVNGFVYGKAGAYAEEGLSEAVKSGAKLSGKTLNLAKTAVKATGLAGTVLDAGGAWVDYAKGNSTASKALESTAWAGADVLVERAPVIGPIASTIGTENISKEAIEHKKEINENLSFDSIKNSMDNGEYDVAMAGAVLKGANILTGGAEMALLGGAERKIENLVRDFSPETADAIGDGWKEVEQTVRDPKKLAKKTKQAVNYVKNGAKTVAKKVLPKPVYNQLKNIYNKVKSWF